MVAPVIIGNKHSEKLEKYNLYCMKFNGEQPLYEMSYLKKVRLVLAEEI